MVFNKKPQTVVEASEKERVVYRRKNFLIFSWWEQNHVEKIGKDLVINTTEDYNKIIINGRESNFN